MKIELSDIDLPIVSILPEIENKLKTETTLLVNAPPGAGKSTTIPLALLNLDWLNGKKIVMLEPRRVAARSIAMRMADLIGEDVGETVGYRVRFDTKVSSKTKIEVVTEGILTRMLHSDNSLEQYGVVIFDEFHERSLSADLALALIREAQQIIRPDLRIVVMSATLDMAKLSTLLDAPSVTSEGRQHPISIKYVGDTDIYTVAEQTAEVIKRALSEQSGDILAFLPGEGEIRKTESKLNGISNIKVHPLYGQLTHVKQQAAIYPDKERCRKVILATSIAETSLTIEGVTVVVDSGFGRESIFDTNSGLSKLDTIMISKDRADQRAGRAGRLSPGTCYRMWSLATQERLHPHRTPEIQQCDLTNLALDLAMWGVSDPNELIWLTPPATGPYLNSISILESLGAIEHGKITKHGRKLAKVPAHPRIAQMLINAGKDVALATDIAAILEVRDRDTDQIGIDINPRVETLRRERRERRVSRSKIQLNKIADSYRKLMNCKEENGYVDPFKTGKLLVHAYPERIAHAREGNNAQFQLANGSIAMASHKDSIADEPWLIIPTLNQRDSGIGKIFLASPLDPEDLVEMVKKEEKIKWNRERGAIVATTDMRIGNIVLRSTPLQSPNKDLVVVTILDTVSKYGEQLLNFNSDVIQLQNRVLSLREWNSDLEWPDISTPTLLKSCSNWLQPYINGVKKREELKRLDLFSILKYSLDPKQQQELDKLAPTRIKVPSGSMIKVAYFADGSQPVLSVKIQEMFGLAETPKVNRDQIALLIHLLSPGFKPVQVTSDLNSFWNNAYFEVKKELKRRYPKHAWPDDPWSERAARK